MSTMQCAKGECPRGPLELVGCDVLEPGDGPSITTTAYAADRTSLLIVGPYNDFMSEGGQLYEATREGLKGGLLRQYALADSYDPSSWLTHGTLTDKAGKRITLGANGIRLTEEIGSKCIEQQADR
jgi:hypothetical protein